MHTLEPNRKMIIAIDFDGTCVTHDFPRIGQDIGAVPVLKELIEMGHQLILYTIRGDDDRKYFLTEAVMWFERNEIPLWGINTNPLQDLFTNSPKVHADLFIDDRSLNCPLINNPNISKHPFADWEEIRKILIRIGYLNR